MKKMWTLTLCFYAILMVLSGCSKNSGSSAGPASSVTPVVSPANDVKVAKSAFTLLVNGDQAVANMIYWEKFQVVGMDVGTMYSKMPNDAQKKGFRNGFISSFSSSYKKSGATAASLSKWRIKTHTAAQSVVIADTLKKTTLSITVVNSNGKRKISAISQ